MKEPPPTPVPSTHVGVIPSDQATAVVGLRGKRGHEVLDEPLVVQVQGRVDGQMPTEEIGTSREGVGSEDSSV